MPWPLLGALIEVPHPVWWVVLAVVVLVLIWLALRLLERVAGAANLLMFARDRRHACEEALHGKTRQLRQQGLAVLTCLQADQPDQRRKSKRDTRVAKPVEGQAGAP